MQIESFATSPLQQIIPAYLYEQYSDDAALQAFVQAYNTLAQGYLDWFNSTPLPAYTDSNVSGDLLDWAAQGIYGIQRPVISSIVSRVTGAMNTYAMNSRAMNRRHVSLSGSAQPATDDYYKRVLTWFLYAGDGKQFSISWLRRRVARFLYGVDGQDISLDSLLDVSIKRPNLSALGAMGSAGMNTQAMNVRKARSAQARHALQITIPSTPAAQVFIALIQQGILALPFQIRFQVALT